jgi:anhydro-N-acetylmuramic acid kinase
MAATLFMGLMSGTSMDGVDAVLVEFGDKLTLHGTHAEPMPPALKAALIAISQPGDNEIDRLGELDIQVGELFARAANALLAKTALKTAGVRAIGSHGQTIRHRPQAASPFTLQIGDPNVIAERTGISVVADFRRRDMAAGGQGAPLVPAFHQALFRSLNRDRVIVNLGGIANITVLRGDPVAPVYGFDTGPASGLMDAWSQRERNEPFDRGGQWAASGTVNLRLLSALLAHPYFAQRPPKSTGREDFHLDWLLGELAHFPGLPAEDVQATLLELTARTLSEAIKSQELAGGDVILCGGGTFNTVLCKRLGQLLASFKLHSSADYGLAPNWVEATAFAWLARQTLQGMPGSLPTVTGARGARILGSIHPA